MKRGFTLIELLVVIAIIALLSSVILASLASARDKAYDAKVVTDGKAIQTGLELEFEKTNTVPWADQYPTCPQSCGYAESLIPISVLNSLVTDGFLPLVPTPPAGKQYFYIFLTNNNAGAGGNYLACGTEKVGRYVVAVVSDTQVSNLKQVMYQPINFARTYAGTPMYCMTWDKL